MITRAIFRILVSNTCIVGVTLGIALMRCSNNREENEANQRRIAREIILLIIIRAEMLRSPRPISILSRNATVGSSKLRIFKAATIQAPRVIILDHVLSRISTVVSRMMIHAVRRLTVTVRIWCRQPAKLATKLEIYCIKTQTRGRVRIERVSPARAIQSSAPLQWVSLLIRPFDCLRAE